MSELEFYNGLLLVWPILSGVIFLMLLFLTAPYGRHTRKGWGPEVSNRVGWILMECPSVFLIAAIFFMGTPTAVGLFFLILWEVHYVHRTFVFPFRIRSKAKPMPLMIALSGFFFNCVNSYLNGRGLSFFSEYPDSWFVDPRFAIGVGLFVLGFAINFQSDQILLSLRKPGETGYKIPKGGLYRWVSCPNYLGEMLEWTGWAIATWSSFGLIFAVWTAANLIPRAVAHHRWYREKFPDYPAGRKAVIPLLC